MLNLPKIMDKKNSAANANGGLNNNKSANMFALPPIHPGRKSQQNGGGGEPRIQRDDQVTQMILNNNKRMRGSVFQGGMKPPVASRTPSLLHNKGSNMKRNKLSKLSRGSSEHHNSVWCSGSQNMGGGGGAHAASTPNIMLHKEKMGHGSKTNTNNNNN